MNELEKALAIITSTNYEVSNIEKFSYLYYYLNTLKKNIEEIEKVVRKKGSELMNNMDLKKLEYNEYEITKIDPTEIESYSPSSVIEALGMERAIAFLKVDSKITAYLKKASAMGAVSMSEIDGCRKGLKKKLRTGYIKIQKKKLT
jgi:hypothetical protein